ncbi:MAG: type II toxin-antitoxin system RelE/ParE family toxin [Pirellulales bacterium]
MYTIEFSLAAADEINSLRAFERTEVLAKIDEQLAHQPTQATRNKKLLPGLSPAWFHVPPIWELRASELRVFYDVDETRSLVTIRAVRRKPPHATTETIL